MCGLGGQAGVDPRLLRWELGLVRGHIFFVASRLTKMAFCSTWHGGAAPWLLWQLGEAQHRHNNHAFNRLRRSKELLNHPSYIWGTPILRGTCREPRKAWTWKENLLRLLRLRNGLGVGWAGFFPVSLLMAGYIFFFCFSWWNSAVSLYKEEECHKYVMLILTMGDMCIF